MNRIIFLLILLNHFFSAKSQVAGWQFGSPASLGNEVTYNATTTAANTATSVLSRGVGVSVSPLGRAFSSTNFSVGGTKAGAISGNQYFAFNLSPNAGYQISLSGLGYTVRRSGTGPNMYIWQYSVNGVNFFDIGTDITNNNSALDGDVQPTLNLSSIPALQNVASGTTIYFRLYAWGATGAGGTLALGRYGTGVTTNSLEVLGTVSPVAAAPVLMATPSSLSFGNVCVNTSSNAQSFLLNGTNLTGTTVAVGPFSGYGFATVVGGPYSSSLSLPIVGGAIAQTVYVRFSPVAAGANNGTVVVQDNGLPTPTSVSPAFTVSGTGVQAAISASASANPVCTGASTTLSGAGGVSYAWSGPQPVTNGTAFNATLAHNGIYTVTGTDANGCTATSTVNLVVNPIPTVTASATVNPVCAGSSTTLSGNGANTYTWTGGVTNGVAFIPAATTTYTVTGTSAAGCTSTSTITVTVNPLPTVTASATVNPVCAGSSTTLSGNGANTYTWTGGVTNGVAFIPAATTTYTVTGTSAAGCTSTSTITVTVNPLPTVTASATVNPVCAGGSTTLSGNGANTYTWTGGVTNGVSFTPAATTTYTVTGTSAAGCTSTSTITVTVNPLPTVTASATVNPVCAGGSTTLSGNGANTYTWTGGVTNGVSFTPAATTTYTVTGTSAAGCTSTSTITVTVNPIPTVTASVTVNPVCSGGSTTLNGNGANTYSWTGGVTNGVAFTPVATTTYTVTGTSAAGCTSTSTITVTVNPLPAVTASATVNPVCSGGSTTLSGNGANTYTWTGGVTNGVSFTPAATTTYTVTGTSAAGCTSTSIITVTVNPIPNVTASATVNPVCSGGSTTLSGNGANTYTWTGGVTNGVSFIPAATATYTVTGTSAAGCTSTSTITVTVNPLPAVTASATVNPVCAGGSTTLSGNGANTYTWTGGVTNGVAFTPVATTTYTVTGTSAAGCTSTSTITVTVNPLPAVTASATVNPVCSGGSTTLSGNGANTYTWTGGVTNGVAFTPVATTTYTVTGTSAAGCTSTSTITVTVNPLPAVTASATVNPVCSGGSTTLSGNGANTYTWTGGVTNGVAFTPVATTTYTVTGTSAAGCTSTSTITVTVNPLPAVTASATVNPVCSGGSTTLSGNGANTYTWTGGVTNGVSFIPAATATYTVTGTSAAGCTSTSTITVTVNPTPAVTASASPGAICPGASSVLTGGGAAGYAWNPGALVGSPTVTPAATTSYTVTGTDVNGCTATSVATVTVNPTPAVTASASPSAICIGGSAVLTGNGATSYAWNPGALVGSPTVTPIATTNYTVTGTDANGCTATSTVDVVVNGLPTVTASPVTQTVCENGMATVSGGGAATYTWTGGITDATPFMVMAPATYTVTGTDANGCTNTATAEVFMNAAPLVSASATPNTTCNMTSVTPNATGANSYVWTGGLTNGVPFVAMATATYTVTGTDGGGCTATSTVTVTVNPASGVLAPATSNQSQDHGDDFNINYYDGSCDLIATVDDGAAGNILGLTTSTVNVDATVGFHNGQPFVRRWYQITPTSNGSADVILYINQSDFDDYNAAVVAPYLSLPTSGNNADPNVANIRITKNDNAGLGNNPVVITPTVNWNGTYWELSFNTPSFSQFRVHGANPGGVPLPVMITGFNGRKLGSAHLLSWTTSTENNNDYFTLQHAADGVNFNDIEKVNTKAQNGNSNVNISYSTINLKPVLGHNYYRLRQTDIDSRNNIYAEIVDLICTEDGSSVSIYPNPATDVLNIDLYTPYIQNTTVKILDMSGRVVKQIQTKSQEGMNHVIINIVDIADGLYSVQLYENERLIQISKVKKVKK